MSAGLALICVAILLATGVTRRGDGATAWRQRRDLWHRPGRFAGAVGRGAVAARGPLGCRRASRCRSACRGSARISGIDALSAFFLVVVNLGGAAASLYALGYGRHEQAPERVLPFYPGVPRRHEPGRPRRRRLHLPVLLGVHVARLLGAGDGAPRARPRTRAPATSISSWRASARWRCCSPSACSPAPTGGYAFAAMRAGIAAADRRPRWSWRWRCSAPARRPASCRCTSGCRSPIRPRRATSRR